MFFRVCTQLKNLDGDKFNQVNKIGILKSIYKTITINEFINIEKIHELLKLKKSQYLISMRNYCFIYLGYS
jgi:hypothetical protein